MNELAIQVVDYINVHGVRRSWIAEKLGIIPQKLNKLLNKKNFTIEDANYILEPLNAKVTYVIEPK